MTRIAPKDPAEALGGPEAAAFARDMLGYIPNSVLTMAHWPELLNAFRWHVSVICAGGQPIASTDAHYERLSEQYSDKEQVEFKAVISMFGFLNRWNDTLATSLEDIPTAVASEELAAKGWDRGDH